MDRIFQIYDRTFKRILTLSDTAVINLINGLFGTNHPINSKITYNWTEYENKDSKRILEKARTKENIEELQKLIEDDIMGCIEINEELGNISAEDARNLKHLTWKLYLEIYSKYTELEVFMRKWYDQSLELEEEHYADKLDEFQKKIKEKEEKLWKQIEQIQTKEEQLQKLDEQLQKQDEQLQEQNNLLQEKDNMIKKLTQQLEELQKK